jgi:hypothetical protein
MRVGKVPGTDVQIPHTDVSCDLIARGCGKDGWPPLRGGESGISPFFYDDDIKYNSRMMDMKRGFI